MLTNDKLDFFYDYCSLLVDKQPEIVSFRQAYNMARRLILLWNMDIENTEKTLET